GPAGGAEISLHWAWQLALVALATACAAPCHAKNKEFPSDTLINNVVTDPRSGRLYVGAVNRLYQLSADLQVESRTETGPKRDNKQCTPPVTDACEEAVDTDNHNKLLLVQEATDVLVVCGSVFRGICSLRNLSAAEQLLYFSDSKGEKSYVATAEEGVSVVGVTSYFTKETKNFTVFLVGKGYGSHDSTKLISTRILQDYGDWVVFDSIIEASAVQANPFVLRYLHDFRFAFKDGGFVYFLFSRTLGVQDTKNFTFVSRMCEDDQGYYSYTELQLNCSSTNKYNKAQVMGGGGLLLQAVKGGGEGGHCLGILRLNEFVFTRLEKPSALTADKPCYSDEGNINEKSAVYSPYSSKSEELCKNKNPVSGGACGAEYLPSPLASKAEFALTAEPLLAREGHMTAVAVAVENGHAVAFLGTANGEVLKVHLSGHAEVYGQAQGDVTGEKVNKNLLFDPRLQHLYVTTEKKVRLLVPVQACHLKTDCESCVSMKDPYCGWCVLEGKLCVRPRHGPGEQHQGDVWTVPLLQLCCHGQKEPKLTVRPTTHTHTQLNLTHTHTHTHTHTRVCVSKVRGVSRCIACVTSEWGCQWNAQDYSCSDKDDAAGGKHIIKPQQVTWRPVHLWGRIHPDRLVCHTHTHTHTHTHVHQVCESKTLLKMLISFNLFLFLFYPPVVLYNCSVGREDCSLCQHADAAYRCVWCSATRRCVYRERCPGPEAAQCPPPQITDIVPRFGPPNGQISVTIKGSNMGIKREDVKKITVAGVECVHQADRYSVSTSRMDVPMRGAVEVELEGGRKGTSQVIFTYRDPKPLAVVPSRGPAGGGTLITVQGENLDTGTRDDVSVAVGGVPCEIVAFGEQITCRTGRFRGTKVPSELLPVTVLYGKNTTKEVGAAFQYLEDPKLTPSSSSSSSLGQFVQEALSKNETVLQFLSPTAGAGVDPQALRTFLHLDNEKVELKNFVYHPDPSFNKLDKNVITETGVIIVTVRKHPGPPQSPHPPNPPPPPLHGSVETRTHTHTHTRWLARVDGFYDLCVCVCVYRRKSQQAEREYGKVKNQLANLEESVRDRCKKEFTDLMIEMEDHTSELSEARIPFLDYKTYTDRNFFLPSKDGANDAMITGKIQIPEARKAIVAQALNQFSNLLNSKTFLINFIRTLESRPDFNARSRGYFASLLTVALHGKLEYYTDIMRTLLLELMDEHVQNKNPKLMLRRSETVVERMLCNWMSICIYQFLRDTAGEPLYKLFRALKHQVEKGPVDAMLKKAKYTLNDTGLLGDDVEYSVLTLQVLVHGEGPDVTPVKVLNCDTITQVKEKIIDQVYRNLPYSQRPVVESVALEWRPGSTGQILSDMDLTSQQEGRWKRLNTLAHYNVRDNATLVLSRVLHTRSFHQHQDSYEEKNALLEEDNTYHLVRPADEMDYGKSKRGSMKDKAMTKAITEIYLTRLLSVKGTLQQFVDDFFRSVLCSSTVVPPAVKYFFDFLDEQAERHDNVDEETLHIWKTNSLPLRFWVTILRNPHYVFDVHVTEVVDASLHVISQTFMDACTKTEHKLSRESPSNKLLYAREISTYKKMQHTDKLNTQLALHQLYQYASKYYDVIIQSLDEDPAAQNKQLTLRLQQIAAALENKVTDL
uniref:Sema domain-containing protein n=1 Tax=Gasterosteus aculeatus aculeatus TaxID=481459 RepID=A0AAQ4QV68_GASAC